MLAESERQIEDAIDDRWAVAVQQRYAGDGALLRLAARKGLRLRAEKLTAQRFVLLLGCADHLSSERRELVLHFAERRLGGALERRIQDADRLDDRVQRTTD